MSGSLLKSSIIVSTATMLSRVLGMVRDIVVLHIIGASAASDAYLMAQRIPNFLRRLFAEGAFAQSFVPVLTDIKTKESQAAVLDFIGKIAGTLGTILLVVTLLGILGSSGLMMVFGSGFMDRPEQFDLASGLLKITFPYILFISLTAFSGAIFNSYGRFAVPAITPIFLNISIIVAALFFAPHMQPKVEALAWGIFAAGVIQLAFQIPFLWKMGLLAKPQWGWGDSQVKRVITLMIPILFGVSVNQINLLVDSIIASHLVVGSISWLYSADRLMEFPLGVFGIAIGTVILPLLSQKHSSNAPEEFNQSLNWGLRLVFIIGAPSLIGLFLLAEPMVLTLFQHGEFNLYDASQAAIALRAYALGLLSFMLVKVLAPGYFARHDSKTPVDIGIKAMIVNMFLNFILIFPLHHAGLALATSLSATLNAFLLYRGLRKAEVFSSDGKWAKFSLQMLLALLALSAIVVWLQPELTAWQQFSMWERSLELALVIGAGALVYVVTLLICGVRVHDFRRQG